MKNHSGEVPAHLRSTFETLQHDLRRTSEELVVIESLHREAILERVASGLDAVPDWDTIVENLQTIRKQYNQLVAARIALTQAINYE